MTDRGGVEQWVRDYERLWRTPGTDALGEIFTDDVSYLPSPWASPITGLADLAAFWDGERVSPDEGFTMTSTLLAVEADRAVARMSVDYALGDRWRNLWVLRFDEHGRCRAFEEWPFAPDQPDGH